MAGTFIVDSYSKYKIWREIQDMEGNFNSFFFFFCHFKSVSFDSNMYISLLLIQISQAQ